MDNKYDAIIKILVDELSNSSHDIDHVMRVYKTCLELAKHEHGVDQDVLIPAALLHDIAKVKEMEDKSGKIDHSKLGADMAEDILIELNFDKDRIEKIKQCIYTHRFRSGEEPESIEAKILFDADKLDVLGAIGIARLYMIAGKYKQKIYSDVIINEYIKENIIKNGRIKDNSKHAPNIEYELKLKKIPDRLFTQQAKEIAIDRLKYMEIFFDQIKNNMI